MEKLFAKIKKESLRAEERAAVLSVLKNFVSENPIQRVESPFIGKWFYWMKADLVAPAIMVIFFILTGGTVLAAKNSLPGDILYPIKMLSENIESKTALNHKTIAKINTTHAVARLKEIEKIAASNKPIDTNTVKEIENNFRAQSEKAINNINQLKQNGDENGASKLQSSFTSSLADSEKNMVDILNATNTKVQTKRELSNMIYNIHSQLERVGYKRDTQYAGNPNLGMFADNNWDRASSTKTSADSMDSSQTNSSQENHKKNENSNTDEEGTTQEDENGIPNSDLEQVTPSINPEPSASSTDSINASSTASSTNPNQTATTTTRHRGWLFWR
jgi:hypothetical protein